ncbi:hypothetical protein AB205_0057120, partial [Aquarana catesbeiana]
YGNMNPSMMGQAMSHGGFYGQPQYPGGDPMWSYFTAIAGQDGEVDAEELQRCLTQAGVHGTYTRKSETFLAVIPALGACNK